jgi:Fe2+ transport system protein B
MSSCSTCDTCGVTDDGVDRGSFDGVVALAGNPNTGKSTVFNALTGMRQHTGNWPGKTVARAEGRFAHGGKNYKLVDLPGTYSLLSASEDEQIARDFILFGRPDCTVVVADATCLERNLNLALQVLEISDRVVVCVNLMDEAKRKGVSIDAEQLSKDLGVPVVKTTARSGRGLSELVEKVADVIEGRCQTQPHRVDLGDGVGDAVSKLVPMIHEVAPGLPNARWVAMRLLDGDWRVRESLLNGELSQVALRQQAPAESFSRKMALEGSQ